MKKYSNRRGYRGKRRSKKRYSQKKQRGYLVARGGIRL